MQFDSDGRLVQITLSVGAAEASLEGVDSFEDLWQAAEESLARVTEAGGDRYELREEPLGQAPQAEEGPQRAATGSTRPAAQPATPAQPALQAEQAGARASTDSEQPWSSPAGSEEEALTRRLQAMLSGGGMPEEGEFAQLKDDILTFALSSLGQLRDRSETAGEYERRIELLQRRLEKVSQSLESTEQELRRVTRLKDVDDGLASIYRSVQGLESSATQGELKRELMKSIFEANLELKKHMEGGGAQ